MGQVIGDILPVALGVAISPVPVIAVVLMLLAPKAKAASVGFLLGWIVGVAVVVSLVALLAGGAATDDGEPSTTASVIQLVLGLLLLLVAVKQWRSRPRRGETPELPKWMAAIDSFTAWKAAGLAFVLAAVNPKNLTLALAGGVTIASGDLSSGETWVAIAVFVVIASSSVGLPVLGYLVARSRMQHPLDELRVWLTDNNATVMAVLMLVLGVATIGKGLGALI